MLTVLRDNYLVGIFLSIERLAKLMFYILHLLLLGSSCVENISLISCNSKILYYRTKGRVVVVFCAHLCT
jgi:hypothetical protein